MEKKELMYEGKAKKVYSTEDDAFCIVSYKDDATAFNGEKKGTIVGKGVVNNRMSNFMFKAAGSFSKRFGVPEGTAFNTPTLEYCLKDDALGDPMINDSQIIAIGAATKEELDTIADYTLRINEVMKDFFKECNVELIDFKIEFGRLPDGTIILADEISPDTCRFWDMDTHEKLDKDRFRRDMGGVEEAYAEMMKRVGLGK